MNVDKILAISGKPGLYELKLQTRTGFVAESLIDGKKITVGLRSNVSLLSEISMYTESGEKPLVEVMRAIAVKENEGVAPSSKEDNATLLAYFGAVVPDYDQDRVYVSDIKKVLNWYNILQAKGMVSKEEPKAEKAVAEEAAAEKPAKKAKAEKAEATEEKPKAAKKPKAKKSEE
ncbi:DUF5606 domain-containing protein [Flavobacterium sp. MAH-1]|uniref:DUF5606 domain-containing protein n=1 Tax=Flavobacterium agri TaxID=2743471 RepID=A0A7Y9C687_9FLAO|nr:DUF5606 domain-containing protein [Flavobacterium agri]NUY81185.1 DUF5606 domain-containing protein [Flavobacterium agri]NYA71209.1 DUF5606 domain-containing protein [Flavobacterium agri]